MGYSLPPALTLVYWIEMSLQQPAVAFHPGHLAGTIKAESELKTSHHLVSGVPISLVPSAFSFLQLSPALCDSLNGTEPLQGLAHHSQQQRGGIQSG